MPLYYTILTLMMDKSGLKKGFEHKTLMASNEIKHWGITWTVACALHLENRGKKRILSGEKIDPLQSDHDLFEHCVHLNLAAWLLQLSVV